MKSSIVLAALLAPLAARADGAVVLFSAIGTPSAVTIGGRVLKDQPTQGSSPLSKNLRRLLVSNWEGAHVEIRYGGTSRAVVSGKDGEFQATFSPGEKARFPPGLQRAEAAVPGATLGSAGVEILAPEAPFFVVSDFDDTVAVTEVLSNRKLLVNSLLKDESTQQPVKGMAAFYGCLRSLPGAPGFALVSGSPLQFADRMGAFLAHNQFPPMGLYLRELGPGTLSNYKQPVIRTLMRAIPEHSVVLVGDSGEHDPEVYRRMNDEFPGRVRRIYIRNAGHAEDPTRFEGMVLFDDPKEAALDAATHGLAGKECVSQAFP